ncbi:MAG: LysE family translocator [Gammaproteobacteria bacterium]|jgi:threonine/homoserine/homoserine lactone efflux protein|tara:strand:+ start:18249 stop:18869 length:621 start_codon:yes stop_codon:yes gene_type:complete
MNISLFLSLAFAHLVAVTSPGPDFFYIVKSSFEKGLKSSVISAVGIGLGVFLHCLFAIVGLDFLYQKIPSLYTIIGTVGAGYLIYLGVSGIFADPEAKDLAVKETQTLNLWQSFTGGLMVNIFNVKAFIFFVSLFSGVALSTSILFQISISVYFFLATATWFIFLSFILNRGFKSLLNHSVQRAISKISSCFLIAIGFALGVYVWA